MDTLHLWNREEMNFKITLNFLFTSLPSFTIICLWDISTACLTKSNPTQPIKAKHAILIIHNHLIYNIQYYAMFFFIWSLTIAHIVDYLATQSNMFYILYTDSHQNQPWLHICLSYEIDHISFGRVWGCKLKSKM